MGQTLSWKGEPVQTLGDQRGHTPPPGEGDDPLSGDVGCSPHPGLKSLTGGYSKLQPHQNISLSQYKVEIFMAVFLEKFIGEFF